MLVILGDPHAGGNTNAQPAIGAAAASQLLLLEEAEVDVEVRCTGCGHLEHEGTCTAWVELGRARCSVPLSLAQQGLALAYVARGECGCTGEAPPASEEVH